MSYCYPFTQTVRHLHLSVHARRCNPMCCIEQYLRSWGRFTARGRIRFVERGGFFDGPANFSRSRFPPGGDGRIGANLFRDTGSLQKQESWATANLTAQHKYVCQENFRQCLSTPAIPRLLLLKFLMVFSDRSREWAYRSWKFVPLLIPEIIGGTRKIWALGIGTKAQQKFRYT